MNKCIGVYYDCSVKVKFSKRTVKSLQLPSLAKGLFKCMLTVCSRSSIIEIYSNSIDYTYKYWNSNTVPIT